MMLRSLVRIIDDDILFQIPDHVSLFGIDFLFRIALHGILPAVMHERCGIFVYLGHRILLLHRYNKIITKKCWCQFDIY